MIRAIWIKLGNILFWLCVPMLHVYLRRSRRARVVVIAEGRVLVVKSWLGSGRWTLPGGGVKAKESPAKAVIRELQEETGLIINKKDLISLGQQSYQQDGLKFGYQLFEAQLSKRPAVRAQQLEIIDVVWLPLENVEHTNVAEDVTTGLDTFLT